jgi:hypothetical protein
VLQDALEAYERALAEGGDAERLREVYAAGLGDDRMAFLLATSLPDVAAPTPEPAFAAAFAAKLRATAAAEPQDAVVLRPRFGARIAPLAIAACTIAFAALLIPAFDALPRESLYALKGAAEDARVWFATGSDEASVRVDIADERFAEVEALLEGAELRALASSGTGLLAAPMIDAIEDPEVARLIEETLADASFQLEKAAEILTNYPATTQDLDRLVDTSRRGQELATQVSDDLPNASQPPVVRTVVKLAKIEAEAKAAKMKVEDEQNPPTPGPCATPTPTPTATPTTEPDAGTDDAGSDELTPAPEETPEVEQSESGIEADPSPSPTPESTPCISPTPSPEPSPTTDPEFTPPAEETEPSDGSDGSATAERSGAGTSEGVDGASDEQSTEMESSDEAPSQA